MLPITSSSITRTWLKLTGKDRWPSAAATVFSSEFISKPFHTDGHLHVVYSFEVAGMQYSGEFFDYTLESEEHLRSGDVFEIRFNPHNPRQSYYPKLRTRRGMTLVCSGIGLGLAVLVIGIRYLLNSSSQ